MISIALANGMVATVDDAYAEIAKAYHWCPHAGTGTWYARAYKTIAGKRRTFLLHRVVMGVQDASIEIDHVDQNGLNCCMSNLRIATHQENCRNRGKSKTSTSGEKGVYWHAQRNRWRAQIKANGKVIHLGLFDTISDAAAAYRKAELYYFGEFARKL